MNGSLVCSALFSDARCVHYEAEEIHWIRCVVTGLLHPVIMRSAGKLQIAGILDVFPSPPLVRSCERQANGVNR